MWEERTRVSGCNSLQPFHVISTSGTITSGVPVRSPHRAPRIIWGQRDSAPVRSYMMRLF